MWLVERSDIACRSWWATGRDAKHYISCLGHVVAINYHTFDIRLPSGKRVTAKMVKG
jgi:hypothetical protein